MPQILKTEIREKILQNALDSFLEKGYKNTSMKEIAQKSGIAVGNIYNYFKDKEKILSTLIEPVLSEINAIFDKPVRDLSLLSLDKKINSFIEIYRSNQKIFVMLLEKSDSTKFETVKKNIIEKFSFAIVRAKNTLTSSAATQEQEIFIKAYSRAFINGIISILAEKVDEKIKLDVLYQFLSLMRAGLVHKLSRNRGASNEI